MTPEEIEQLTKEIIAGVEAGLDVASIFTPQTAPFILIGKAVDKVIPGLAKTVAAWVDGNPPTASEIEEFKARLAVLGDPSNP